MLVDLKDPRGKRVRITGAHFQHVLKHHKGITIQQVAAAISSPDYICDDRHVPGRHEAYYARGLLPAKFFLKVIVEKERLWKPGRLRTAHGTSEIHPQDKVTWKKP